MELSKRYEEFGINNYYLVYFKINKNKNYKNV